MKAGDFRGHLFSLRDPSRPLSSFTPLLDNPHPFNLLRSAWNPCQFLYVILQSCLSTASSLLTTGRHICCSLCFYLELGIWEGAHTWTRICVHSRVELWGCEHTCAYACTCACMDSHGCPFTHFHGHRSSWMTAWAHGWVCVWSIYTHTLVSRQGAHDHVLVWCGAVGYIPCASGFVCVFAHVCFCVSVCIWCELASPCAPGGTKASANYKEQRNNLHNLAFDLCHPQASFALTSAAKLFPQPCGLCLWALSSGSLHLSSTPHEWNRGRKR